MSLTIAEHMEQLRKLSAFASAQAVQAIIVPRANELLAVTKNRITIGQKDSSGQLIGQYSRKPGYYGREAFVNKEGFIPQGKNGVPGRGERKPKTMYLPQGYYQFRQIQGRNNPSVNLTYTGDTLLRYQMDTVGGSVVMGMTTNKAAGIRKGHEQKYAKAIYHSSKQEIDEYNKQVVEDFRHLNTEILAG